MDSTWSRRFVCGAGFAAVTFGVLTACSLERPGSSSRIVLNLDALE